MRKSAEAWEDWLRALTMLQTGAAAVRENIDIKPTTQDERPTESAGSYSSCIIEDRLKAQQIRTFGYTSS